MAYYDIDDPCVCGHSYVAHSLRDGCCALCRRGFKDFHMKYSMVRLASTPEWKALETLRLTPANF
jgi:hypothetical protein